MVLAAYRVIGGRSRPGACAVRASASTSRTTGAPEADPTTTVAASGPAAPTAAPPTTDDLAPPTTTDARRAPGTRSATPDRWSRSCSTRPRPAIVQVPVVTRGQPLVTADRRLGRDAPPGGGGGLPGGMAGGWPGQRVVSAAEARAASAGRGRRHPGRDGRLRPRTPDPGRAADAGGHRARAVVVVAAGPQLTGSPPVAGP